MVFGTYRDLFTAVAASAASLTGLLFVAISVAPRSSRADRRDVIRQVRAAASLLAFTNVLSVSLFGLVPGNNVGYPAIVLGIIGVLFTLAGLRSMLADPAGRRRIRGQLGLIGLLMATFTAELATGFVVLRNGRNTAGLDVLSNVVVASLLIGVARAWELVGDRDTGIISSIAALAGRERPLTGYGVLDGPERPASAGRAHRAAWREPGRAGRAEHAARARPSGRPARRRDDCAQPPLSPGESDMYTLSDRLCGRLTAAGAALCSRRTPGDRPAGPRCR